MRPETERVIEEFGIKFNKKNTEMLEEAEKSFAEDEHVIYVGCLSVTVTTLGVRKKESYPVAMVCFTNKRLIVDQKLVATSGAFTIDLKDVRSVASRASSARNGFIDLTTDAAKYEIQASNKKEKREKVQNLIADAVKECQGAEDMSAGMSSKEDIFAQIERLGELRDKRLVTDEEFDAKKSELLARL